MNQQQKFQPLSQQQQHELVSHFLRHKKAYISFHKAKIIMQQILDTIQRDTLLSTKQENSIQFMFLLQNRAYNYLKQCAKILGEEKIPVGSSLANIDAYFQKAKSKFLVYSQIIDQLRKKIGKIIGKLLAINKSVEGKEQFLDGFQGLDYTQEQQIQFTYNNYIGFVLNSKEIKSEYFVNHRFKKILRGYKKICMIQEESIQTERDILKQIQQIIMEQ